MSRLVSNNHTIGDIGEKIVAEQLGAVASDYRFDSVKDMIIPYTNETVEVKTQVRYVAKNVFAIDTHNRTNFDKCMEVDRLIFVEIPQNGITIRLWECIDRRAGETYSTNSGKRKWGWYINKMRLIRQFDDADVAMKLKTLSSSSLFC
jgi:hypothetical protein